MALYKEPYMFEVTAVYENNDLVFSSTEVTPNQLLTKYQAGIPIFMKVTISDFTYLTAFIVSLSRFVGNYCEFTNGSMEALNTLGFQSSAIYLLEDGSLTLYDPSRE